MQFLRRSLPAVALALAFTLAAHAQVPTWPKTTPADVTAAGINVQVTGADYGNGTFVLAAYFGGSNAVPAITPAVYTSADGTTWTKRTLPVSGTRAGRPRFLNGKFYLGTDLVANSQGIPTGAPGSILSSADGITWTAGTLSTAVYAPQNFAYANGVYLATASPGSGQATQIITSTDGFAWTARAVVAGTSIRDVGAFNGNLYCTVSGGTTNGLYTSTNGIAWTRVSGAPNLPGELAASAATLLTTISVGSNPGQSLSADGVTFATASPGLSLFGSSIRYFNGAFVAATQPSATNFDNNVVSASFDGRTWTTIATTANQFGSSEVVYGNGRYVFVGEFDVFSGTTTITPGGSASGGGGGSTSGTIPTTLAELSAASLTGKSLNFTITGGNSPFESSGEFTLQLDVPSTGRYTIAVSSGSVAAHTDRYTYSARSDGAELTLNNYIAGQDGVGLSLFYAGTPTALATVGAGKAYFEMSTSGANKRGTFNLGGGSSGGGTTAPAITTQPATQSANLGGRVTFTVVGSGTGLSYQWYFNNAALAGAINAAYTIASAAAANAGNYTVTLTNSGGAVTSNTATLTVLPAGSAGAYLSNLSIRSNAGSGAQTLIVGVTVGGSGTKNLLIRGIGPTLAAFNLAGALADPKLEVFSSASAASPIATNDNWDATATPLSTQVGAGAFPLTVGSRDAALVGAVPAGGYSVQLTGVGGATGIALAELYDLTPAANFTSSTPRLINISARTQVGIGGDILITGFNVSGTGTRRLLIRAVGPTLGVFGLSGTLADPKLDVFSGPTVIASNDNWDATTTPLATQTSVGAFPLVSGTKDAVLIVNLAPGSYTAQVSGVGGTTGVALVEIYELP